MKFTDLSIDNFGALSKFGLAEIGAGLNVLHGPNGSGKTTLLQFIRGVFAGFDEARRRQLIPPVGSGAAGGTIGVEWGSRRLAVIRHSRPDEYETLAINVRQGVSDEGQSLRKHIEAFDDERLSVLFTAGSFDANSVEALINLARQDGLDLTTIPGNERPLSTRLTHLHSRRSLALREAGEPGRRDELLVRCEAIAEESLAIQKEADERRAELLRARIDLDERLAAAEREVEALHLDWQAVTTDLRECEDRLWSGRSQTVVDVVYVQESEPPTHNPRLPAVEEIDLRIEHLRTALKDLAASRQQVSVEAASATGSDVPDRVAFATRQREALRVMQMQLQVLTGTVQWMESARRTGSCVCESLEDRLTSVVDELRRQVEFSCQELSRQQTAWRLEQSRLDRAEIDSCETGLQRQIDWLRARREELLEEAAHPVLSRLAHTVMAEREYCGCPQHSATMRATTPRVVTRRTVHAREEVASDARPGDAAFREELGVRQAQAWNDWQAAMAMSTRLASRRRKVIAEFHAVDLQPLLADCELRLEQLRQQLRELEAKHSELSAIETEIRTVESQLVRDQSSRVISESSEHLDLLTLGRYRALRVSDDGSRLQIIAENGSPYVASSLSRGTLFQVALALRIALVDEYARRGLDFPLVLDDVLVDSDEHRLEAAAHLLSAAAHSGRQVLFLTCQDHLVDLLEDRGAKVHTLPGAARMRVARPRFVPTTPAVTTPDLVECVVESVVSAAGLPEPVSMAIDRGPRFDLPASEIPSMAAHFAGLLAGEGVQTMGQVAELDAHCDGPLLTRLGISRLDFVTWKAESELLLGMEGLSKDDAQLLAAVGIRSADNLRQFTAAALWQRIQRFRGSTPQPWHTWMRDRNSWPSEEQLSLWIKVARQAEFAANNILPIAVEQSTDDDPEDDGPQPAGDLETTRRKRTRRSRRGIAASSSARSRGAATAEGDDRYYLTIDSPIVDAPSIGPKMARVLDRSGVQTVVHLLQRDADELAGNISDRSVTGDVVTSWQQQSRLMCEIAELRGHDAQLLVACGYSSTASLATSAADQVFGAIQKLSASKAGQRILRTSTPPELAEVAEWIERAGRRAERRAA